MKSKPTTDNRQPTTFLKFVLVLLVVGCWLLVSVAHAQSVDLLWQGDTYTPPFYLGKSLWSKQSTVTLVAIPHGLGNPNNLSYKWTRAGTVLGSVSGVGRNTLIFTDSILSRPQTIQVDVSSGSDTLVSQSINIAPITPSVVIYENNPLYGFMFNQEIGGEYKLTDRETTFTSFPFFFGVRNRLDPDIKYVWRTNTDSVTDTNSVTYRTPEEGGGGSKIELSASSKSRIVQSGKANFLIKFGEQ